MQQYNKLMKRCIALAKRGTGFTTPNPLVGAVIFDDDFNIVAEGYHKKYGQAHAEVNAVKNANCDLKGMCIAVNLEPCSHHGKTPPCADLIIKNGFKKVVIGIKDPNPIVAGNGIKKLEDAGIEVITGVLGKECAHLNEIFLKNQIEKKPFIAIKTATTLDGKIACKTGDSKWITSEKARQKVQELRHEYSAIITGSNTIIKDNPSLNCRLKNGVNPTRIIVDSKLKTDPKSNVYNNDGTKIIILTSQSAHDSNKKQYPNHVELVICKEKGDYLDLNDAIKKLFSKGIPSILVEGGAGLNSAFIKEKLVDKLYHFVAPKILGDKESISFVDGFSTKKMSEALQLSFSKSTLFHPDILNEYYFTTPDYSNLN